MLGYVSSARPGWKRVFGIGTLGSHYADMELIESEGPDGYEWMRGEGDIKWQAMHSVKFTSVLNKVSLPRLWA